jgi:hypothetical protein
MNTLPFPLVLLTLLLTLLVATVLLLTTCLLTFWLLNSVVVWHALTLTLLATSQWCLLNNPQLSGVIAINVCL